MAGNKQITVVRPWDFNAPEAAGLVEIDTPSIAVAAALLDAPVLTEQVIKDAGCLLYPYDRDNHPSLKPDLLG